MWLKVATINYLKGELVSNPVFIKLLRIIPQILISTEVMSIPAKYEPELIDAKILLCDFAE